MNRKLEILFVVIVVAVAGLSAVRGLSRVRDDESIIPIDRGDEDMYMSVSTNFLRGSTYPKNDHPFYAEVDGFYMRMPPLFNYLSAIAQRAFGPTVYSARLVSVLFSSLTIILIYGYASLYLQAPYRIIAPLLLAITPLFAYYSRVAVIDATYTFFALSALCVYDIYSRGKRIVYLIAAGALLGTAIATKQLGFSIACACVTHTLVARSRLEGKYVSIERRALLDICVLVGTATVVFFLIVPSFFMHPLLSLKHLILMEYFKVIRRVILGTLADQFSPTVYSGFVWSAVIILLGYAGAILAFAKKWLSGRALPFAIVFLSPALLFGRLHYVLPLLAVLCVGAAYLVVWGVDRVGEKVPAA